jgi:hypothetical protein
MHAPPPVATNTEDRARGYELLKERLTSLGEAVQFAPARRAILAVDSRDLATRRMTAPLAISPTRRRMSGRFLLLLAALFVVPLLAAACFVAYVLWPTWPNSSVDAPALPITVAGVLFEVPPSAIRAAVQRRPGPHERIDLVFLWPSLRAPPDSTTDNVAFERIGGGSAPSEAKPADVGGRLFVTIAPLGTLPPPTERLRGIYPRYVEARPLAGPGGLAVLPFRAGTPYEGEDLVYFAKNPDRFYARCTRPSAVMPGTCIQERSVGAADITLRFPRDRLDDWESVAPGFDRLIGKLRAHQN